MAFDMYAGDLHEAIHPSEEILLQMASESPERYPELTRLWEALYEDPELTSGQTGALVMTVLLDTL